MMTTNPLMLAATNPGATLGEGILMALVGMIVVFMALSFIGFLMWLLQIITEKMHTQQPQVTQAPAPVEAEPETRYETENIPHDTPSIPPTHKVIIAAAVAAAIPGKATRVRRVQFVQRGGSGSGWAEQGRASIHRSHALQKRSRS